MNSKAFEEAVADAKKLREVAEQHAKNKIIDAVTPKIRDLIDRQLSGEINESDDILDRDILDEVSDLGDETIDLTPEAIEEIVKTVRKSGEINSDEDLEKRTLRIQESLLLTDEDIDLGQIKEEVDHIYSRLQESQDSMDPVDFERITRRLDSISSNLKTIEENEMSKKLRDALNEFYLAEEDDEFDLDVPADDEVASEELPVDLGAEEELGAEDDLGLEDELGVDSGVSEDIPEELAADLVDLRDKLDSILGGDEESEDDLEDEDYEEEDEVEDDGAEEESEEPEDEFGMEMESFTLDNDLLAELGLPTLDEGGVDQPDNSQSQRYHAEGGDGDLAEGEGCDMSDDDPMEESDDSDEDDVVEESSVNNDDVLFEVDEDDIRKELQEMRKSRRKEKISGGNDRQLKEALSENEKLRKQLNESNLFNAKLLYANKLLQDKTLSDKQRVVVVESIDNARSLREVRLIYKSLSESLGKNLTEGRRRRPLGSSSRAVQGGSVPAGTVLEEGAANATRWAKLAGLPDK